MNTSLCEICQTMFQGALRLDVIQEHHASMADVQAAAQDGCYICKHINREITEPDEPDESENLKVDTKALSFKWYLYRIPRISENWFSLTIEPRIDGQGEGKNICFV